MHHFNHVRGAGAISALCCLISCTPHALHQCWAGAISGDSFCEQYAWCNRIVMHAPICVISELGNLIAVDCANIFLQVSEVYSQWCFCMQVTGKVGRELTVHLTWWTSNTIFCNGVLYCLTSGRPYSIIAYDIKTAEWMELQVPPPKFLFCSFLIERRGKLMFVGGVGTQRICEHVHIWQLSQGGGTQQQWVEVAKMPHEYFCQFSRRRMHLISSVLVMLILSTSSRTHTQR